MKKLFPTSIFHFLAVAIVTLMVAYFTSHAPVFAMNTKCEGTAACKLGDRSYHILPPDNWDGATPLPVLMYFHGWGRQGIVPLQHREIGGATRKNGVLLIAPNGLGKSWRFWQPGSPDTDFAKDILDDVGKRYPVDKDRLMISGYSWGSSMAWRYACEAGERVFLLLGISGTLYDQTEACSSGPVAIRHVHGLKDTVMDFPYGPGGEETGAVRLWLRMNGCKDQPDKVSRWKTSQSYVRHSWTSCRSGKPVTLDVHKGGHWIAKGWLEEQLQQVLSTNN